MSLLEHGESGSVSTIKAFLSCLPLIIRVSLIIFNGDLAHQFALALCLPLSNIPPHPIHWIAASAHPSYASAPSRPRTFHIPKYFGVRLALGLLLLLAEKTKTNGTKGS